jgi:hypothetical protein
VPLLSFKCSSVRFVGCATAASEKHSITLYNGRKPYHIPHDNISVAAT